MPAMSGHKQGPRQHMSKGFAHTDNNVTPDNNPSSEWFKEIRVLDKELRKENQTDK